MSAGVNIPVKITLDASGATGGLTNVESSTEATTDAVENSSNQVSEYGANWDRVGEMGFRATRSIVSGVSGLLSAEQNIYTAQQRVNVANINYTLTIRQYGAGSIQAQKALIALQQAQEGVTLAQTQMNLRWVQFAVSTGPQVYAALTRMMAAEAGETLAVWEQNAALTTRLGLLVATAAALALTTFGVSALLGGIGAASIAGSTSSITNTAQNATTVNQINNFNQSSANPQSVINATNSSARRLINSSVR